MKLKKYILSLFVASCALTTFSSCTDWLDEQPNDKQSEEQQFATKPGFYAAVNGIYDRMSGNSLYGKYLSYEMIDILGQRYEVTRSMKAIITNTCVHWQIGTTPMKALHPY